MPNRVRILTIPDSDRVKLERMARDRGGPAPVAERARIVLLAAEGLTAYKDPQSGKKEAPRSRRLSQKTTGRARLDRTCSRCRRT